MNPWVILGVAVAVATAGGVGLYKGRDLGMAEVQQLWDKEKTEQYAAYAAAQDAAREKEQALQASADLLRKEKDREIRDLNARATALTASLRQRPDRPAPQANPVPNTPGTGSPVPVCTGAELPREDAEFLAREAARADELRASLRQCLSQYEALRQK